MKTIVTALTLLLAAAPALQASSCHDAGGEHPPSAFQEILEDYEPIRRALLHDHTKGVADHARGIRDAVEALRADFDAHRAGVPDERSGELREILPQLEGAARLLSAAEGLEETRREFYGLSKLLIRWREMATGERPVVVFCPMASKSWLQPAGEIGNPYHGQSMPRCGKVVSADPAR